MRVYVCGDTHIPIDIGKLSVRFWEAQKYLTRDDIVIVLGDFGLFFHSEQDGEELWWAKWLTRKNFTVCFIDGNHENFDRVNSFVDAEFCGGKVGSAYMDDNGEIIHLRRGEIYTFNDKKVFVFGGALSVDKQHRIDGVSWWKEELASHAEQENAFNNLERAGNGVDYVLTHTCPESIADKMRLNTFKGERFDDPTCKFLDAVHDRISFKEWHFGHFHTSAHLDEKYICHYNWEPQRII